MAQLALARRYRPQRFADLVGQEHVVRALGHSLGRGELHHALLFTGTRGVGKTTIARIVAKSLNCETGISAEPCGVCGVCREVEGGRFVDLIEIDAASRTRVDDTRELLDSVLYAPARGRFKVYLIDEVHMLSLSSFNALLKTLEEPPPHVRFLLATTDPEKLPITVLSRCLKFSLKRLSVAQIRGQLERICAAEQVLAEAGALTALARAGDGSMRDALSLADQALAYGGGALRNAEVEAMLGLCDPHELWTLADALITRDAASVLAAARHLLALGNDPDRLLSQLATLFHRLALAQLVPADRSDEPDHERLIEAAQRLSPVDLQVAYQIATIGRKDLDVAPDPAIGLEMALMRWIAFKPDDSPPTQLKARPAPARAAHADASGSPAVTATVQSPVAEAVAEAAPSRSPVSLPKANGGELDAAGWASFVAALPPSPTLMLAQALAFAGHRGGQVVVDLAPEHTGLASSTIKQKLATALSEHLQAPTRVELRVRRPETSSVLEVKNRERAASDAQLRSEFEALPPVRALIEQLDARVVDGSVRAVDRSRG